MTKNAQIKSRDLHNLAVLCQSFGQHIIINQESRTILLFSQKKMNNHKPFVQTATAAANRGGALFLCCGSCLILFDDIRGLLHSSDIAPACAT